MGKEQSEGPQLSEKEGVERWLNKSGYPLEMQVAAVFRIHDFRVSLSAYFEDAETQKPRELDVLASSFNSVSGGVLSISIPIECKKSTDKPWVLFCADKNAQEAPPRFVSLISSIPAFRVMRPRPGSAGYGTHPFISDPTWVGYGLRRAHSNGVDEAYSAAQSVAKAGIWMRQPDGRFDDGPDPYIQVVLPTIVVEGSLYACYLNDDNRPELESIDRGLLNWPDPTSYGRTVLINVVTATAVDHFAAQAQAFRKGFDEEGRPAVHAMAEEWRADQAARIAQTRSAPQ